MSGQALSPLDLVAWALIALGGLLLLFLLGRLIRGITRRFQPLNVWNRYAEESSPFRRRRRGGWVFLTTLLVVLLSAVLVSAGWGLFRLQEILQAYSPFPEDQLAGRVQCSPAEGTVTGVMTCSLNLESPSFTETVTLEGIRWGVEGEMLVWSPTFESLGLRSGYRVLHLLGYDAAGQVTGHIVFPSSQGDLAESLLRLANVGPFLQVRRDTVYGEVVEDKFYDLIVSQTGFSVQEWGPVEP
jgi:hypothetical protein